MPQAPGSPEYPTTQTDRMRGGRFPDRLTHQVRPVLDALDEGWVCHVGFVSDGAPVVLPTLYGRRDDQLILHGATGSRLYRMAEQGQRGVPVCLTVTLVDGLVIARSSFHHAVRYRSVVVHGNAYPVPVRAAAGELTKGEALRALLAHAVWGRKGKLRPPTSEELAETGVLRVALNEATLKSYDGGPEKEEGEEIKDVWAGVVPVCEVYGTPRRADWVPDTVPTPDHLVNYRRPGQDPARCA
ncbi:pyridoxamine 5'-phosphate oxidase family protein [Streptomyces marincola]|nr:pyridoxamine 5'-phosphate oxidase family protein [Streptomyces marincola]